LKILSSDGVIDLKLSLLDSVRNIGRPMKLSSKISFSRDENNSLGTNIGIDGAEFYLENEKWKLDPARVLLGHHYLSVNGFRFHNARESLNIGGTVSELPEDELTVSLNRLHISLVNEFLTDDISLGGTLTGIMRIKDFYGKSNFVTNIVGSDISFYDNPLGNVILGSKWDSSLERINLQFLSRYKNREPLNIFGYYCHRDRDLMVKARLNELSVAYARPFVSDILRIDGGRLSGNVVLKGKDGRFSIGSEDTRFVDFAFTPLLTNVPYIVNGGMKFTEDRIDINDLNIKDRKGREALLQGYISHHFLTDMELNLRLSFKDLECIDIEESSGASVYGTATGSGSVSVSGPLDNILVDARVRTGEGTSLHVPVSNTYAASSNEILVFRDYSEVRIDPYDSIMTAGMKTVQEKAKVRIKADA
ncbi:MAG: translocation/assembly module TamB domain-containing protein, partial [Alistipes sp.]|nr:translocation/assembly module TamB domain-containing protein [Candidatus Minthomonas equi]